ncbi:hypothetical protein FOA52_010776 [Chlamydomonas sp. UWO 241]|nr:hypothetical protein FOA52_010776 [Chlamydomonas sp. UWO 241]
MEIALAEKQPEQSKEVVDSIPDRPVQLASADAAAQRGAKMCRFCLSDEDEEPSLGPLITPCLCRDHVHQECLRTWRATNSVAFYSCNVCKWQYRFRTMSPGSEFGLRLAILMGPVLTTFLLALALGGVPLTGPPNTLGQRLLNGLSCIGLLYLTLVTGVFNFQYCAAALESARASAQSMGMPDLPNSIYAQLVIYLAMRCLFVALFYIFCIAIFFPFSAFMGLIILIMAWPTGLKDLGDRIVRHLEFRVPVMQVTPVMEREAAAAAAEEHARTVREAAEAAARPLGTAAPAAPAPAPHLARAGGGGQAATTATAAATGRTARSGLRLPRVAGMPGLPPRAPTQQQLQLQQQQRAQLLSQASLRSDGVEPSDASASASANANANGSASVGSSSGSSASLSLPRSGLGGGDGSGHVAIDVSLLTRGEERSA